MHLYNPGLHECQASALSAGLTLPSSLCARLLFLQGLAMSSRGPGFRVGSVTPSSAAFCFCFVTPLSEQVRARVQGPHSAPQAKQKRAAQGSLLFGSLVSFLNVRISRWHVCVSEAWTCQAGRPSDHLVEVTSRRDGKPKKARATVARVEQKAARVWLPPLRPSASDVQLCLTPGVPTPRGKLEQRRFWDGSPKSPAYGLGTETNN